MSWSNLPATAATDWLQVDFVNQFIHAINERRIAVGASLMSESGVGDDGTARSFWRGLQVALEDLVDDGWWVDADDPYDLTISVRNGGGPNYFTLATWRAKAGIDSDGFERRYPRTITATSNTGTLGQRAFLSDTKAVYEHDGSEWVLAEDQTAGADVLTARGLAQVGDYAGPWLLNELQAGLQVLRWSAHELVSTSRTARALVPTNSNATKATVEANYDQAVTEAEAEWPSTTASELLAYGVQAGRQSFNVTCNIRSRLWPGEVPVRDHVARSSEWWNWARKIDPDKGDTIDNAVEWVSFWDANGRDVAQDTWTQHGQTAATTSTLRASLGGHDALPNGLSQAQIDAWLATYEPGDASLYGFRGFAVDLVFALVKWDVTGGFEYT